MMLNSNARLSVVMLIAVLASASVSAQQQVRDERSDDRTSGTITGTVVNENGQPLSNAAVIVRGLNSNQSRNTATAADGTFVVRGLDPSLFGVFASLPTYVNKPREADSAPIFYRAGDNVRIEMSKGGVITGTVTTPAGDPVVAVRVRAYLIRHEDGNRARVVGTYGERTTDDRGVYRIYGVPAGVYVVAAGGASSGYFNMSSFDSEGPTFAPSSTRDTASEFTVRPGEETTNVDIKFRFEVGHQVSGIVRGSGGQGPLPQFTATLTPVSSSMPPIVGYQPPGSTSFAFSGVSDGTYDVTAQYTFSVNETLVSDPYRIVVKGADVTGIVLVPKPLATITGKLLLEPSKEPECKGKRRPVLTETLILPLRNTEKSNSDDSRPVSRFVYPTVPDAEGGFSFRALQANQYGFDIRQFAKYWYLNSISLPSTARQTSGERSLAANRSIDVARNWINLKSGERVTGLSINLAEGAASFKGLVRSNENEPLPSQLYLHLVPADRDKADDVLRFFASPVNEDRSFALGNLPPGRYWALVRPLAKPDPQFMLKLRLPAEAETRARLRRDAEAAKVEVEFRPCQNIDGYELPFKSPTPPKQP